MIKGILFDKDGTLLDFYALWKNASLNVIDKIFEICEIRKSALIKDEMCRVLGINGDLVDANKALAWMTYDQIAEVLRERLLLWFPNDNFDDLNEMIEKLYYKEIIKEDSKIIPTADFEKLFSFLKSKNLKIGIATADTKEATEYCLNKLHIYEYFDYIGVSSKDIKPKPFVDLAEGFKKQYNIDSKELVIVGDTPCDMIFARNCDAVSVGVLSGTGNKADLEKKADIVLKNVGELEEYWNEVEKIAYTHP